jgi:hypothetical protein
MHIPEEVRATIEDIARSHGLPAEMWKGDDGYRIMDGFFELALVLKRSGKKLHALPRGYSLLVTLFRWEAECQSESWNAFQWTEDIKSVIQAYSHVGLEAEARAIDRARLAWQSRSGDYDAANAAYAQWTHAYSSESKRLEYLVDYFCLNAHELFYLPEAA